MGLPLPRTGVITMDRYGLNRRVALHGPILSRRETRDERGENVSASPHRGK